MRRFAEKTQVPISKSRGEKETLLAPSLQPCTCAGAYKVIVCTRCKGTRLLRTEDAIAAPVAAAKPRKKKRLGKGLAKVRKAAAECKLDPMVEAVAFGTSLRRRKP